MLSDKTFQLEMYERRRRVDTPQTRRRRNSVKPSNEAPQSDLPKQPPSNARIWHPPQPRHSTPKPRLREVTPERGHKGPSENRRSQAASPSEWSRFPRSEEDPETGRHDRSERSQSEGGSTESRSRARSPGYYADPCLSLFCGGTTGEDLQLCEKRDPSYWKKKYRQLALSLHPDKPGGSEEKMKELNDCRDKAQTSPRARTTEGRRSHSEEPHPQDRRPAHTHKRQDPTPPRTQAQGSGDAQPPAAHAQSKSQPSRPPYSFSKPYTSSPESSDSPRSPSRTPPHSPSPKERLSRERELCLRIACKGNQECAKKPTEELERRRKDFEDLQACVQEFETQRDNDDVFTQGHVRENNLDSGVSRSRSRRRRRSETEYSPRFITRGSSRSRSRRMLRAEKEKRSAFYHKGFVSSTPMKPKKH